MSRLVVDPERFVDDEQEIMASRGMGTMTPGPLSGALLRRAVPESERQDLLNRWYRPHHAALKRAAAANSRRLVAA